MTSILHTETYRAASNKAKIKVQRYVDFGFGPRIIWRIVLKKDDEQLARVLEDRRFTPPSRRTIMRHLENY